MWGFVADSVSGHLCRGYAGLFGAFPASCQSDSGTPALAITLIVLFAGFVLVRMAMAARRPR